MLLRPSKRFCLESACVQHQSAAGGCWLWTHGAGWLHAVLFNNPVLSRLRLLVILGYKVMKGYGGGLLDYFLRYI